LPNWILKINETKIKQKNLTCFNIPKAKYPYILKDCLEYYFLVKNYEITENNNLTSTNVYRDYLFFMGSKDQKDINVYNQQIYNNVLKYLNYNL
jgi:hypothetical protein